MISWEPQATDDEQHELSVLPSICPRVSYLPLERSSRGVEGTSEVSRWRRPYSSLPFSALTKLVSEMSARLFTRRRHIPSPQEHAPHPPSAHRALLFSVVGSHYLGVSSKGWSPRTQSPVAQLMGLGKLAHSPRSSPDISSRYLSPSPPQSGPKFSDKSVRYLSPV